LTCVDFTFNRPNNITQTILQKAAATIVAIAIINVFGLSATGETLGCSTTKAVGGVLMIANL
jgi:hypothetical protein